MAAFLKTLTLFCFFIIFLYKMIDNYYIVYYNIIVRYFKEGEYKEWNYYNLFIKLIPAINYMYLTIPYSPMAVFFYLFSKI